MRGDFGKRVERIIEQRVRKQLASVLDALANGKPRQITPNVAVKVRVSRGGGNGRPIRKKRASKARRQQGAYMAAVRGLSKLQKNEVRTMKQDQGIEAAINLAREFSGTR